MRNTRRSFPCLWPRMSLAADGSLRSRDPPSIWTSGLHWSRIRYGGMELGEMHFRRYQLSILK